MSRAVAFVVLSCLAFPLAGCASGPTVDGAQERLDKGDAEGALLEAREVVARGRPAEETTRARRVAFEAGLALGRSDEAARDYLELHLPTREQARLGEKLAASTLRAAIEGPDAGRRAVAASELALAASHQGLGILFETALADPEPAVRRAAAIAVAQLPDLSSAAPRLARLLADDVSADVRGAAALALAARIGKRRTGEVAEAAEARTAIAARAGATDGVEARTFAEALDLVGVAAVAARPLVETAPVGSASLDAALTARLQPVEPGSIGSGLVSPLYERRLAALVALVAHPMDPVPADAVRLLDDPVEPVRVLAVDAVAASHRLDLLERTLASPDDVLRRRAFIARDRLAPFTASELSALASKRDPALAPDAARLLAERGGTKAVPVLVSVVADVLSPGRAAAALGLGALGGADAGIALVHALASHDGGLRRAAAEALARSGSEGALDDLVHAIAQPIDDSDLAAAAAMLAIDARTNGSNTATSTTTTQEAP
jgi:HEAT repeat protein